MNEISPKKSVTLLFPGQGSQYVGMGKDLDHSLFDEGNKLLGLDLKKLMHEGPEEELKLTHYTQPAILKHSLTLYKKFAPILTENKIEVDCVLGHSVGEFSALTVAGVLSPYDAIHAVHLRGKYMQEAVPAGVGTMYAILKVPENIINEACSAVSTVGSEVMPANYNEPNQIVISGEKEACQRAVKWIADNYKSPHRAIELNVSAPFHSTLMKKAADKLLHEAFKKYHWHPNTLPYIANVDAKLYDKETSVDVIKKNLYLQSYSPVLWSQSISCLPSSTICLEVGPGKVLKGLVQKINKDIKVIALDRPFDEVMQELKSVFGF